MLFENGLQVHVLLQLPIVFIRLLFFEELVNFVLTRLNWLELLLLLLFFHQRLAFAGSRVRVAWLADLGRVQARVGEDGGVEAKVLAVLDVEVLGGADIIVGRALITCLQVDFEVERLLGTLLSDLVGMNR